MNKNFRLLAIRPQQYCDNKFLKNLKPGMIYKFYNNYSYYTSGSMEIINSFDKIDRIVTTDSFPDEMFKIAKSDLEISISALVGKNGSGKSSILELLYVTCYMLASEAGFVRNKEDILKEMKKIENDTNFDDKQKLEKLEELENQLKKYHKIRSQLDVEIIYEIDHSIYKLYFQGGNFDFLEFMRMDKEYFYLDSGRREITNKKEIFSFLQSFFYTISINYSQYGLNEKSLGDWASHLFHKNDGYQTPLVVNPYRIEGNIDVNNELHLSQTRLISNLITTDNYSIVNEKKLDSVEFRFEYKSSDSDYLQFLKRNNLNHTRFFEKIYSEIYKDGDYILLHLKINYFDEQCNYIFNKIIKIREKYYKSENLFVDGAVDFKLLVKFLRKLSGDRSHVTLKLRQVLNNISLNILRDNGYSSWKSRVYEVNFDILVGRIKKLLKPENFLNLEEFIPIGCFIPTINVLNEKESSSVNRLMNLSSGEQHLLHTTQAIYYHLLNLDSVHSSGTDKVKYQAVNIIFDEIELYFHPEFQRIFIFELLQGLNKLTLKKIKKINILFCTHSPFILSDIPSNSILKIDKGSIHTHHSDREQNTFGANIYDLLKDDFFLADGFIGEFAKNKILSLIMFLEDEKKSENKTSKVNQVKDRYEWKQKSADQFIQIVGEPLLKRTLRELYFNKFQDSEAIDNEIQRLQELKRLQGLKNRSHDRD